MHAGRTHALVAGAHDLAVALEVDDRDGRGAGQRPHFFAQRVEHQGRQVHGQPEFARARPRERRTLGHGE